MNQPLALSAPARPAFITGVHELLDTLWAQDATLGGPLRQRFETAVVEIVGNVVVHSPAAPGRDEVTMSIELTCTGQRVVAEIRDDGGEVPHQVASGDPDLPDDLAEHGRGLALARACTDELTYCRKQDCNLWTVVCLR